MHQLAALLLAGLFSAGASACPLTDTLAERYGISFSGSDKPLPATTPPPDRDGASWVRMVIHHNPLVSDGFRHAVVLDKTTMKAWIVRYGGFTGGEEWFGPVDAAGIPLEDCRIEPPRLRQAASAGQ